MTGNSYDMGFLSYTKDIAVRRRKVGRTAVWAGIVEAITAMSKVTKRGLGG